MAQKRSHKTVTAQKPETETLLAGLNTQPILKSISITDTLPNQTIMSSNTSLRWAYSALILLGSLPVLPLFVPWHLEPVNSFHEEGLAITIGLLACMVTIPLIWQDGVIAIPKIAALPLCLALYITFQSVVLPQVVTQHAAMASLYLVWATLLMVTLSQLKLHLDTEKLALWLAVSLAIAAAFSSLLELIFRFHNSIGGWGGMVQANNFGDLLALGGISLLVWHENAEKSRLLVYVFSILIIVGLSLTPSRSVWLYWSACISLAWFYRKAWIRPLVFGLVSYLLLQTVWKLGLMPTQTTAMDRLVQEVGGVPVRLHIWQVAWNLFLQSPFLGQGFGQFDWAYFHADDHIPLLMNRMEHAHNLILHLLAELGLLPVLLLSILSFKWLYSLVNAKSFVSTNETTEQNTLTAFIISPAVRLWLLLLFLVLFIHSMLEYPLWYAQFLGILALILALGDSKTWQLQTPKPVAVMTGSLLSYAIATSLIHHWYYTRMEMALMIMTDKPTPERFNHLINVCQNIPEKAPLLMPYVPVLFTLGGEINDDYMRAELVTLTDAAFNFWPTSKLAYRQALMQGLNGKIDNAMKTLELAITAYPNEVNAFLNELMHMRYGDLKTIEPLLGMTASAAIKQGMVKS